MLVRLLFGLLVLVIVVCCGVLVVVVIVVICLVVCIWVRLFGFILVLCCVWFGV